jgi:hypothetical protein
VRALLSDASRDLLLIELRSVKISRLAKSNKQATKENTDREQTKENTDREQTRDNRPNESMSSHITPVESEVTGGLAAWGRH